MSIKVMSWVWEEGPADQAECFVLLALADFANDAGECWPSIPGIARKVRMKDRGVRQIIRRLEAGGWLVTSIAAARAGANHYRIVKTTPGTVCPPSPVPDAPGITYPPGTTCRPPRHLTTLTPAPGAAEPSITITEPSEEVTPYSPKPDLGAEFVTIWEHYPRKVGRGAALKAWTAARKRHGRDEIAKPLGQFIRAIRGTEIAHIPHLATWLNQERWGDEQSHARNGPRSSVDDLDELSTISSTADLDNLLPLTPRKALAR